MIEASGHITIRRRAKDGQKGDTGLAGQLLRCTEFQDGTQYHNDDESVTAPRYLDIVYVYNGSDTSRPWRVYQCLVKTNDSTTYTAKTSDLSNSSKWKELNNLQPIYVPLIIAQNALLRLLQSNQILVMKADGTTVNLGLGGGQYPLWIGAANPTDAKSYWDIDGKIHAVDGEFTGKVTAESGLIGGFYIRKDSSGNPHLISTHGTLNGAESDDYTNSSFVPAIDLDGKTGQIKIAGGTFKVNADGSIAIGDNFSVSAAGKLKGSGAELEGLVIKKTVSSNGVTNTYKVYLDSSGKFWIYGDLYSQGVNNFINEDGSVTSRSQRYYSSDIWCRGYFGHRGRNVLEVHARTAYFHTQGQSGTFAGVVMTLSTTTDSKSNSAKEIPLYGGTANGDAAGFPVDVVIFSGDCSSSNYVLSEAGIGKTVIVANANDNASTHLYVGGVRIEVNGGKAMLLVYVGNSMLVPATSSSYLGKGWMTVGSNDNNFVWT